MLSRRIFATIICTSAFFGAEAQASTIIEESQKLNKLGHNQYDRCNFAAAASYYSQAITLNPKLSLAYSCRADCYHKLGNFSEALNDYNQALKLQPQDSFNLGLRAEAKVDLNDLQGALSDYDTAIKMGPTYYFLFADRAKLRLRLHDSTGAIADCDKAMAFTPCACEPDLYRCRQEAFAELKKRFFEVGLLSLICFGIYNFRPAVIDAKSCWR